VDVTLDGTSILETTSATNDAPDIMGRVFATGDARTHVNLDPGVESLLALELEIDPFSLNMIEIGARPTGTDDALERAVAAAAAADVVILMLGTTNELETEGLDRETTLLPAVQRELAERVLAANTRAVVAINAGAAVDLECVDSADAVMYVWLAGQELGPALADVIIGEREPGGRLPITLAADRDYPIQSTEPDAAGRLVYSEGVFVGYRWFDEARRDPLYCFGHGLGYTTHVYEDIQLVAGEDDSASCRVDVTVRNAGERRGKEVVQLYVGDPGAVLPRPRAELKAFEAIELEPGEARVVRFDLDARSFAHWDSLARGWRVREGTYLVSVGRSSRDLPLTAEVSLAGGFQPTGRQPLRRA
jgi:beta-glucosidase